MKKLIITLVTTLIITGCNLNSNKTKVAPNVKITQKPALRFEAEVKTPPATKVIEYEKLSLPQAFEIAEQSHLALALALSNIQQTKGDILQAGLGPNPRAIVRMESLPLSSKTTGQAEIIAGIGQDFPLGKRITAAVDVAQKQQNQLSIAMQVKRLKIHTKVQLAYANGWYWSKAVDVWTRAVGDAHKNLLIAQARLDAGDTIATEVSQVNIELQRTQLELEKAISLKKQSIIALAVDIGKPDAKIIALDDFQKIESLNIPALDAMIGKLEQNLLSIASQAEINTRQAQVILSKEHRKPDMGIDISYRRLDDNHSALDLGFSLPIPFFDRNQGNILKSKATLKSAQIKSQLIDYELAQKLRQLHGSLLREVNSARLLRDKILPQSQKVLHDMELRYKAGDASMSEILIIRRDSIANQIDYLKSLKNVIMTNAELIPFM